MLKMDRLTEFRDVRFVQTIPRTMEYGVLYVSEEHGIVMCLCPDGCGHYCNMPIKPIWPTGWTYEREGNKVTLSPSVLETTCPNRAHFFIRKNKIEWV